MSRRSVFTLIPLCVLIIGIAALMVAYPRESLAAAVHGVAIWWGVLFPALFPFFVISEVLLGFGIVHFFGMIFDPMMRPVFRIPGIGGFVVAMGFASGYPVGAKLTSQLWKDRLVNREEGERLVAFTTSSDPIFLIGAVCVGFFHDASLAAVLAAAHYGGALLVGFLMRFHGRGAPSTPAPRAAAGNRSSVWARAFKAMHKARLEDGRPFGTLLAQGVRNSLNLIFLLGSLVVFFSVVLEMLTLSGVIHMLSGLLRMFLSVLQLPPTLSDALIGGTFEVTLGAKAAGSMGDSTLLVFKTAAAAFILSWGGLSVHAQIVSVLSQTNMRYAPFLTARILHSLLASLLVFVLWKPMRPIGVLLENTLPAGKFGSDGGTGWLTLFPLAFVVFAGSLFILFSLYLLHSFLKRTV
ncbi:sporulation integral membrane protein YlbJ [Paenibacillus chitinolyticus]|uniref:sporulation integral membrane protein YlbJ n=1 Tax=Paenibacillus chitinolyticus TaxID=79263 RepID=UPI001C46AFD9|nr:sporulation integral membrane protein YlbJ [Paenibacillus chitinolyticus]MBV6712087.1 sporulation integral membrane protein YlbJ [Paenibacillus chitinolyticus]